MDANGGFSLGAGRSSRRSRRGKVGGRSAPRAAFSPATGAPLGTQVAFDAVGPAPDDDAAAGAFVGGQATSPRAQGPLGGAAGAAAASNGGAFEAQGAAPGAGAAGARVGLGPGACGARPAQEGPVPAVPPPAEHVPLPTSLLGAHETVRAEGSGAATASGADGGPADSLSSDERTVREPAGLAEECASPPGSSMDWSEGLDPATPPRAPGNEGCDTPRFPAPFAMGDGPAFTPGKPSPSAQKASRAKPLRRGVAVPAGAAGSTLKFTFGPAPAGEGAAAAATGASAHPHNPFAGSAWAPSAFGGAGATQAANPFAAGGAVPDAGARVAHGGGGGSPAEATRSLLFSMGKAAGSPTKRGHRRRAGHGRGAGARAGESQPESPGEENQNRGGALENPFQGWQEKITQVQSDAAQRALEAGKRAADKQRIQGNDAYKSGRYAEAIEAYSAAADALRELVAGQERGGQTLQAHSLQRELSSVLGNLGAAQLMAGRPWASLASTRAALALDAGNQRPRVREGTCLLRLGLFREARGLLQAAIHGTPERPAVSGKALEEALERRGELEQVEAAVEEVLDAVAARLSREGARAAREPLALAVDRLEGAVHFAPHSEAAAIGLALGRVLVGKLELAEGAAKGPVDGGDCAPEDGQDAEAAWRMRSSCGAEWRAAVRAVVQLLSGDLEAAAGTLDQLQAAGDPPRTETAEQALAVRGSVWEKVCLPRAMVRDAAAAVREALALKKAGNDKFAHGRADDALALYTQALGSGAACAPVTAPRFAAVLHSNRAACHQKLGRNAEALADCCRALALAPGYSKALSRMASLLGVVGRHEDAEKYLRKMLECADVKASAERRRDVEERIAAEQGHVRAVGHGEEVPDHFQILGLKTTCSSDEVRKAYKQLARSIHPDKALATCGGRLVSAGALAGVLDLGVWVDGAPHEEDAKDRAGWLFKCVQEAVSTLTDPHKRTAYEAERETAQRRKKYWSASARSGGVRHGGFGHVPRHSNPFSHNFYAGWGAYDEYDDGYGDPWGDADGHEYYTGYAEDYSNMRREQQQRNGGGGGYARAGSFGGAHRAHAGGRHYGHGGYAYRGAGAGGAGRR